MGFFVILIIIGVVIYVSTQNTKATREKWRAAANGLNLSFVEGGAGKIGTIQGSRNGHRVRVTTYTKNSGKSSQSYTKYTLLYRERIPFDLKMTRQGALFAIKQVFGFEDVELGDPAFDSKVIVRSAQPVRARAFLTSELRDAIYVLVGSYPTVEITNEHVEINKTGRDVDSSVIGHCVRRLEDFADAMVERKQGESAAKSSHKPEIKKAPSAMPILNVAEEPVVIEPIEPSLNPFISADPIVPEPPVIEIVEPAEEPAAEPESPAVPLELKAIAEALYGSDAGGSLAVNNTFAEQYENREVTGFGELKRVGKFSYDPVFKDMKGTKATFEICQIAGTYSKVKVKAEVVYPVERFAELKAREGASLSIAGTLIEQDAMMNQLYVVAE